MTQLLNVATQKVEDVDDVPSALAAETHVPIGAKAVVNPSGDVVTIPDNQVYQALTKYGYRVPTQSDLNENALAHKYGEGSGNEVKAFGAGAARGATLGLSDYALPALGVTSQEALRERAARSPIATGAGELAGAVGSALAFPELSPVGLLGKAGGAVERALAPSVLGEGAGLATRALQGAKEIGAKAIGSAVEGAAFGGGQSVSEAALGDPDLTAEKVIGNIGMGAAFGGALGAAVEAGSLAVPASFNKAGQAVKSGWTTLFGEGNAAQPEQRAFYRIGEAVEPDVALPATGTDDTGAAADALAPKPGIIPSLMAKANEAITGTPAEETEQAFATRQGGQAGEVLAPKEFAQAQQDFGDAVQSVHDTTTDALNEAASKVRPQEVDSLLKDADPSLGLAKYQEMLGVLNQAAAEMENRPAIYPQRFPAKLRLIEEDLQNAVSPKDATAADYFHAINEAKQAIDTKIPWNKEITGEAADAVNLTKGVRGAFKTALEDQPTWGDAAARQAAFNNSFSAWRQATGKGSAFQKLFMQKLGGKWVTNPRSVSAFMQQINDPRGAQRIAALRGMFKAAGDAVDQLDSTYKNAPFESFDKNAHQALIQRSIDQATRAQGIVAAQPSMGFGGIGNAVKLAVAGHFGGPLGVAASLASSVTNPEVFAAKLANLERAAGKTTNIVGRAAKAIFKPVANAATKGAGVLKEALSPEEKLDRFKDRLSEVQSVSQDPEALASHLSEATHDSFDVAPKVTQALQMAMLRGNQYLRSQAPQPPPQLPFDREWRPNSTQIAAFDRAYETVEDPTSALGHLQAGTLTPEHVQALQAVYPKLLSEMRQELLSELVSRKANDNLQVPYQRRLQLSTFLGQPLDTALTQPMIASNQISHQSPSLQSDEAKGEMPVKPSQKGLGALSLSERMKTSQQDAITRERA